MFPEERRTAIIDILKRTGRRGVSELAKDLDVSEVTIRQDLDILQGSNVLRRTHGGAILNSTTGFEESYQVETSSFSEEKNRIGRAAAEQISDGQTIILDSGTTVLEITKHLVARKNLTVVTNSLNVAIALDEYPDITVLMTGGTLRHHYRQLVNPYGQFILNQIHADIAFIGVSGIVAEQGITNANIVEAEMKNLFLKVARKRVVLADSSKIGNVALAKIANITDINMLITDNQADPVELTLLREHGLTVQVV
jgi:DeoR family transcriptional regulator of aga operon